MQILEPDRKEAFWIKAEEKHGTVLGYGMGQYVCTTSNELTIVPQVKKKEKIWGVSYITEKGIFLYRFPHQNWFASMLNMERQDECWIEVFFSSIVAWAKSPTRSFWHTLIKGKDKRLLFFTANTHEKQGENNTDKYQSQQYKYIVHAFSFDYHDKLLHGLVEHALSTVECIS